VDLAISPAKIGDIVKYFDLKCKSMSTFVKSRTFQQEGVNRENKGKYGSFEGI
jgi:glucose-6-phosphate isomerase